jgi:hypothetical protein
MNFETPSSDLLRIIRWTAHCASGGCSCCELWTGEAPLVASPSSTAQSRAFSGRAFLRPRRAVCNPQRQVRPYGHGLDRPNHAVVAACGRQRSSFSKSVPGLGSPVQHLRRDRTHPSNICFKNRPFPANSALRLCPTPPTSVLELGSRAVAIVATNKRARPRNICTGRAGLCMQQPLWVSYADALEYR